jgi:spore germination cell wall hydrolase CwlJ-like protein
LGEAPELPAADATHYHASYVKPYWASSMTFLGSVGDHKFYLEK